MTTRTVRRWARAYREGGEGALVDDRTKIRRAWGDFEGEPDGDLFAIAPGSAIAE